MKTYQILFTAVALTLFKPCFAEYTWSDDGLKGRVEKQSWKSYEFTVEKAKLIRGARFKIAGYVQYDAKGRRVESVDDGIDNNANYHKKQTYQYKKGQLISLAVISLPTNKTESQIFYTYNDVGQKIREQTKSGDSWSNYHTTFSYDKQGRLIREFTSMYKGNHIRYSANTVEDYFYRTDGTYSISYTRGSIGNIRQIDKYSKDNMLINSRAYTSSDYRFDLDGEPDKKNQLSSNTDYWYDKNGLLIKKVSTKDYSPKTEKVRTYKYTFDKKGNIKTKAIFENDKPVYLTEYYITYFD